MTGPGAARPPGEGPLPLDAAAVGLPGASPEAERRLRHLGIDPQRLSIFRLGRPEHLLRSGHPPWMGRMALGLAAAAVLLVLEAVDVGAPGWARAGGSLLVGLVLLQAACDALLTATERLAARMSWDHYVAGTVSEIASTLPELVVIALVIPVSPWAALVIALVTIYNNALVFSLYSYFLPKDHKGKFLMPEAVTGAGTQILIAGAALGSIIGLVMLALAVAGGGKESFGSADLAVLGTLMLLVLAVYLHNLLGAYAEEEEFVREALSLGDEGVERRRELTYSDVKEVSLGNVAGILAVGILGAFVGGERVSSFAAEAIGELGLNPILTAVVLAGFAGMSEYVILWRAHRKGQHRIALANAFGGITQVMFLVLPFTLIAIAAYQAFGGGHPDLPIAFGLSITLLFLLLFPVFFVLVTLLEEDHTLGSLDTAIMTVIVLLVLIILVVYGAAGAAGRVHSW